MVGLTGDLDMASLDAKDLEVIKERFFKILEWIRADANVQYAGLILESADKARHCGLGLGSTPIVILTTLAPGASSLVAEWVMEAHKPDGDPSLWGEIRLVACLPFPAEQYRACLKLVGCVASGLSAFDCTLAFDRVLAAIPREDVSVVVLRADSPNDPGTRLASDNELEARFVADSKDLDRCKLRLQAAGEYVVAYCDLLVALWNGKRTAWEAGSPAAMVEAKRRGVTSGLLPLTGTFVWSDIGPILHLSTGSNAVEGEQPAVQLLHPYRPSEPFGAGPRQDPGKAERDWRRREDARFWDRVRSLERFSQEGQKSVATRSNVAREDRELESMVGEPAMTASELDGLLSALRPIARVRRRAADISANLDGKRARLMRWMCSLVMAAAALFHVYAHWHPQARNGNKDQDQIVAKARLAGHENEVAPPAAAVARISEPSTRDTHIHESLWQDGILLSLVITCALAAVQYFGWYQSKGFEPQRFDYRAIAEGLRVQFYWCMAGLGRSAGANYMQRQRTELTWIRAIVSTIGLPYHRWRREFHRLSLPGKRIVLRAVQSKWIERQTIFYRDQCGLCQELQHIFHALGWGATLAGLAHVVMMLLWRLIPGGTDHPVALGIACLAITSAVSLILRLTPAEHSTLSEDLGDDRLKKQAPLLLRMSRVIWPHMRVRDAVAVALTLTLPWPFLLPGLSRNIPATHDLWIIILGITLLAGAILIAWAEKRLYAEHSRQYEAMRDLFAAARDRMEDLLARLDAAVKEERPDEGARTVSQAQGLIFALGREALDEHAEWLILHRARPLEPFAAG